GSDPERLMSFTEPAVSFARPTDDSRQIDGFRGKFVEIISSPAERATAKPLKKMVGTTGIEPGAPTMSRYCSPAELRALNPSNWDWVPISAPGRAGKDGLPGFRSDLTA